MKFKNLTGKTFGYLTVIEDKPGQGTNPYVTVKCICNKTKLVIKHGLPNGTPQSCGCLKSLLMSESRKVHGFSHTPLYSSWQQYLHNNTLIKRWKNFQLFLKDTNPKPTQHLYRPDKKRKVEPSNYKLKSIRGTPIKVNDQTKNLKQWADLLGISRERARQLHQKNRLVERIKNEIDTSQ